MKIERDVAVPAIAIVIALLVSLAAAGAGMFAWSGEEGDDARSPLLVEALGALAQRVVDAEAAGQVLLADDRDEARRRYSDASAAVEQAARKLRDLSRGDRRMEAYAQSLDRHVYRRFAALDAVHGLRSQPVHAAALALAVEQGFIESRAIRDLAARLQAEQRSALERQRAARDASTEERRGALVAASICSAVLQVAALLVLRRRSLRPAPAALATPAAPPRMSAAFLPAMPGLATSRSTPSIWSRPQAPGPHAAAHARRPDDSR